MDTWGSETWSWTVAHTARLHDENTEEVGWNVVGDPAYVHEDLAPSMTVASKATPDGEGVQDDDDPAHCCQCFQ